MAAVLEAFASQCLLTLGNDSIEISHERLLEAWPRLRDDWLPRGAPADRAALTQLQSNAAEWHRHQHDRSYLYGATRLRAAREAVNRIGAARGGTDPLNPVERDFLAASERNDRRSTLLRRARTRRQVLALAVVVSYSSPQSPCAASNRPPP